MFEAIDKMKVEEVKFKELDKLESTELNKPGVVVFLSEISIRSHLSSWKPPYYAGTVMLRLTAA